MEFRLVTRDPTYSDSNLSINLHGKGWYQTRPFLLDYNERDAPNFTCVVYEWGSDLEPNPFRRGENISRSTIPALSTAIPHAATSALWIDAFCLPAGPPYKHATIGSMDFIYSEASEVIMCLPSHLESIIKQMKVMDELPEDSLFQLEHDHWIQKLWTQQEVLHSKAVRLVSGSSSINGRDFLICLGHSLISYRICHRLGASQVIAELSNLIALDELLTNCITCCDKDHSALLFMSQFYHRHYYPNADSESYLYATVGTVMLGPWPWNMPSTMVQLMREFLYICERDNDYSFIYSSNPRANNEPWGKKWRPQVGLLQPILAWPCWGKGQKGYNDEDGFWLEDMIHLRPAAALGELGKQFMETWTVRVHSDERGRAKDTEAQILADLRKMAYTGSQRFLVTEAGLFFPQTTIREKDACEILVASEVRWAFGAPGLAKITRREDVEFVPGVFVGEIFEHQAVDILVVPNLRSIP